MVSARWKRPSRDQVRRIMGGLYALTLAWVRSRWGKARCGSAIAALDSVDRPVPDGRDQYRVVRRSNMLQATTTDATSPIKEVITAGAGLRGRVRAEAGRGNHRWRSRTVHHRTDPCDRFRFLPEGGWGAQRRVSRKGGFRIESHQ